MRKFAPVELNAFFAAGDAELTAPATVKVIGGSALSFYAPEHSTNDIDYVENAALFEEACARLALEKSVVVLPLQRVAVHQGPEGLDERWEIAPVTPPLKRLTVLIPERHDLALLKISRGFSHDLEGVYQFHRVQPLELKTLVERAAEGIRTLDPEPGKVVSARVKSAGWRNCGEPHEQLFCIRDAGLMHGSERAET